MNERTRPLAAAVIVGVVLIVMGLAWFVSWQDEESVRLGDYGRVTAEFDRSCGYLTIEVEGLRLGGTYDPEQWLWSQGDELIGHLELTHRNRVDGQKGVEGRFTTDDGTEVSVHGGDADEYQLFQTCRSPSGSGEI